MHYRRMDPQPPKGVWFDDVSQGFATFGDEATGRWPVCARELPADMLGAEPWRDRDGTWYWRRSLV